LRANGVPVFRVAIDASVDRDRALAIEIAENEQRRDYTPQEVAALHERLLAAGYVDRPGPRRPGERSAQQALATVIGKHMRTVRRLLRKARDGDAPRGNGSWEEPTERQRELFAARNVQADRRLLRAIDRWREEITTVGRVDSLSSIVQSIREVLSERCRLQPIVRPGDDDDSSADDSDA